MPNENIFNEMLCAHVHAFSRYHRRIQNEIQVKHEQEHRLLPFDELVETKT
jgi:hypothetical protein